MSNLPIPKETFIGAKEEKRWELLYDILDYSTGKEVDQVEKCEKRFCKIEKRNFIEKAALAVTGAVIAFFAWFNK